jgi:hypothetical protein
MFGFGRLASYDYFVHLQKALAERLMAAGDDVSIHVAQVAPNASIRRRALTLNDLVARTAGADSDGLIHLVGHSTGGLDARLVASPSVSLAVAPETQAWRTRLTSVTTINCPHYGTPLASFFTTVSGQRVLRALSALTVVALSLGSPPLAAVGALVAAFGRVDRALGLELGVLDRVTEALLRQIDEVRSREIRDYLDAIRADNGAMVQLMPEAMDLFQAGVEDRPGVLYQSSASMAPAPSPRTVLRSLSGPWAALSGSIFAILYGITSRYDRCYPCAPPEEPGGVSGTEADNHRKIAAVFGGLPDLRANDGVVPVRSQIWGTLVWAGFGDHLDVLGHFDGVRRRRRRLLFGQQPPDGPPHVDWMCSGSGFDRERFATLADAIARGMLESAQVGSREASERRVAVGS